MSIEMTNTARELWCLIEGTTTPFSVTASPDVDIDELKKMIQREIKVDLPAYTLNLWKVRYF